MLLICCFYDLSVWVSDRNMSSEGVFNEIKVALKGTTVLPEPRVSRETIISVLQTHTDLILGL